MSDDICHGFSGECVLSDVAILQPVCSGKTSDSPQATQHNNASLQVYTTKK